MMSFQQILPKFGKTTNKCLVYYKIMLHFIVSNEYYISFSVPLFSLKELHGVQLKMCYLWVIHRYLCYDQTNYEVVFFATPN